MAADPAAPEIPWGLIWAVLGSLSMLGLSYLHLWFTERNRKLYAPLHPLYDDRGNSCWATREDLNRLGTKVNEIQVQIGHVDDRVNSCDHEIGLIRQAQMYTSQEMMEKLGEAVSTLKMMAARVDEVTGNQRAQAEQLRILLETRGRNHGG